MSIMGTELMQDLLIHTVTKHLHNGNARSVACYLAGAIATGNYAAYPEKLRIAVRDLLKPAGYRPGKGGWVQTPNGKWFDGSDTLKQLDEGYPCVSPVQHALWKVEAGEWEDDMPETKKAPVIDAASISEMPKSMFDPMPEVTVVYDNGESEVLFEYYPDEISFSPDEFIGLTKEEAEQLRHKKDVAYLQS